MTNLQEGCKLFEAGQWVEAEIKFREAFQRNPSSPVALFNMGRVLEELKNDHAEDFYLIAAALGSCDAQYELGLWYEAHQQPMEALRFYQVFIKEALPEDSFRPSATAAIERLVPPSPHPSVGKLSIVWSKPK